MELKTNYQYTYFIHPFVIEEGKYRRYLLKMIKDKNCQLRTFEKEKDIRIYQYFLPKVRDFLFSGFHLSSNKLKELEDLPVDTQAGILSKYPCCIFDYNLENDIQCKVTDKKGIFFNIQKVEVICFQTGICFLCIKTNLDEDESFSNVLNFNYKFRTICNESSSLEDYDNIRLQTDTFSDVETFQEFIKKITCKEVLNLNIDTEKFLTYSYLCIDQEAWNNTNEFEKIKHNFIKYVNILPADNSRQYQEDMEVVSKWKYAKMGITKQGVMLFASSADVNNYTLLPDEFENEYFYTYILSLYRKIYLKKLEAKSTKGIVETRRKFVEFTKKVWIQEITQDETGTSISKKIQDVFETEDLFDELKNKYDVYYKELNIERNMKSTMFILIVLGISLIFNILNFIALWK